MDRGWQSLQDYITTQLHSNAFRYMRSLFGGIGFPLRRISAVIVGCSLLVQILKLQKHLVFDQLCMKSALNTCDTGFLTACDLFGALVFGLAGRFAAHWKEHPPPSLAQVCLSGNTSPKVDAPLCITHRFIEEPIAFPIAVAVF